MPLESVRVEDASAAIGPRRQVMQMIEAIVMLLSWHASSLVPLADGRINKSIFRPAVAANRAGEREARSRPLG